MNYGHIHFLFIFVFVHIFILHRVQNLHQFIILVNPFLLLSSSSLFVLGSLLRELTTHFSVLAVHNRKNLFVYYGEGNYYYMRFREDIHLPSTPGLVDDSLILSESNNIFFEPPSPQIINPIKNRQRHDSVRRGRENIEINIRLNFFFSREILVFMWCFMD